MATDLLINELSDKTLQLKVDSSPKQAPLNKTPNQQGPSANSNPAPENKLAERSVHSQDKQPEREASERVRARSINNRSPEKQKSLDTNSTKTSTSVESSPSKTPGISEALAETSRFFNLPTLTAGTLTEERSNNGHDGGKSILPFAKLCERYSYIGKFFGFEPSQYPSVVSFAIETLYNTGEDPDRDIISKLCEDEDHWRKFNHERNLFFCFTTKQINRKE
ncbi:hypothetical protein QCA50_009417 [Cerrena zonata]|uniref:Uncharacterized protein n=1 Tax=Cerrena zonata TaxID=2478898 RepID=A0AAW0GC83_9APHY